MHDRTVPPSLPPPPKKTYWLITLRGDHDELHEAHEHITFCYEHVYLGHYWPHEESLHIYLQWIGPEFSRLVCDDAARLWPAIKIESREVEQWQLRLF